LKPLPTGRRHRTRARATADTFPGFRSPSAHPLRWPRARNGGATRCATWRNRILDRRAQRRAKASHSPYSRERELTRNSSPGSSFILGQRHEHPVAAESGEARVTQSFLVDSINSIRVTRNGSEGPHRRASRLSVSPASLMERTGFEPPRPVTTASSVSIERSLIFAQKNPTGARSNLLRKQAALAAKSLRQTEPVNRRPLSDWRAHHRKSRVSSKPRIECT
jgi:hypothetical protein